MQYIQLVRFSDICSNAMLDVIDDVYCKSYFIGAEGIVINLTLNRNKKLFRYFLNEQLTAMTNYGKVPIITNTCRPWDNWRQNERGRAVRASKYVILDDSVRIDTKCLERLVDSCWKDISKNHRILQFEEIDTFDIHEIAINIIGERFVTDVRPEFRIIEDSNYMYDHTLPKEIPLYLYQEVATGINSINV